MNKQIYAHSELTSIAQEDLILYSLKWKVKVKSKHIHSSLEVKKCTKAFIVTPIHALEHKLI